MKHLFLLRELVKRDFQGRYAGSILGFLWSFIQPLWMLVLFSFVFGTVMRIAPTGVRTDNFGIFLFAGLLPWMAIQEGVQRGATAVTDNAALVGKLRFPMTILVLTTVLAALLHEGIALGIFVVVLAALGDLTPASLPWLLAVLPLQFALTLGLALLLSAVNVFFRDVTQILGMVLTGWFYFTPIVYPITLVPPAYAPWLEANPLTPLVGFYRRALLGGDGGGASGLVLLALVAALVLILGLAVFRRLSPAFVDEI